MTQKAPQWWSEFPSSSDKIGNIAKNVIFLRQEMGLQKPELAELIGLSLSQISRIEKAEIDNPALQSMERIADLFGVSLKELMHTDVEESSPLERVANKILTLDSELHARPDETGHLSIIGSVNNIVLAYARKGFFRRA